MATIAPHARVFCAADTDSLSSALDLAREIKGAVGGIKLGLEFFGACGPAGVTAVRAEGLPVFLDLKLYDIPNTVAHAVRALTPLGVDFMTLHASGGPAMLQAAVAAATAAATEFNVARPQLLAVTVLTSMDKSDLEAIGVAADPAEQVLRLARMAKAAGVDGVVCSAHEIKALRAELGPDFILMVPGIRPMGADHGDQKRVMTPAEAVAAGADHLVIGRPITQAADRKAAARAIATELGS
ncbi:orotidine-5'-phosphate decarboxylase [Govanella unica]|uniref:Orotidine 5'-phosphate decarboxylase n=1 Tax=Govanella unica TaxID=2975056 RepID=A0A9X3Z804_9PROT|nr:orotidine-5'-phosphate decarboxylase [Govania unica]MDA5194583.1 orotidine-5'-phosphate decarboxylase [Govania unica]